MMPIVGGGKVNTQCKVLTMSMHASDYLRQITMCGKTFDRVFLIVLKCVKPHLTPNIMRAAAGNLDETSNLMGRISYCLIPPTYVGLKLPACVWKDVVPTV